jgi:DNA-binding Lrp family transcriptional regulator
MAVLDKHVHCRDHRASWRPQHCGVITDAHQLRRARRRQGLYRRDKAELSQVSNANGGLPRDFRARSAQVPGRMSGTYGSVGSPTGAREDGMVQAYILVQTEVGKAAEVAVHIGQIAGVTQADDVTGPYDVIVRAEADNVDDLGKLVVAQIQAVDGITRTLTCPIVHI